MKLSPQRVDDFRRAIAAVAPAAFGLAAIEVWPGATQYSPHSTVACRFDAPDESLLKEATEEARRLVSARIGVELTGGVVADAGGALACWLEYFPGGANYGSALFSIRALQAALVAAVAERSADADDGEAAARALAALERASAPDVFVQSRFLISAARSAGVPVHNVAGTSSAWQFGWGSRSDMFYMTASTADSVPGHQVTLRKHVAKGLFRELGLPTPDWRLLSRDDDGLSAAKEVGWPCVVKPVDRAFGTGVSANVRTPAELSAALALARSQSRNVLIEAHVAGADHRLMVVDGRLIAAVRREPPFVTGDGQRTIGELIDDLNSSRDGTREKGYLLPVARDDALAALLAGQGLALTSVLPKGTVLALRSIANFSAGGSARDVSAEVHPQIRGFAEQLAASVGLRTAGIDYITADISRSHAEAGGGFIEVNAMPRVRVLMADGRPEAEIGALLLGDRPGRIPVVLIVGDSGTLAELAGPLRERAVALPGFAVVAPDWAQVGAAELAVAGLDPFATVSAVLRNATVDRAVILWSRAQIDQFGLPVDKADRAVVIAGEVDEQRLSAICPEVVAAEGPAAALDLVSG